MKKIILRLCPTEQQPEGIWVAEHYLYDKPEPMIEDLFGTHVIATPYLSLTPAGDVLAAIARLNPDYEVVLA